VALTTHLHLAPRLKKDESYTSFPPLGLRSLFWGELYLFMDIHIISFKVPILREFFFRRNQICSSHNRTEKILPFILKFKCVLKQFKKYYSTLTVEQ